jgi:two-component system sensor histidine kinase/response regulator
LIGSGMHKLLKRQMRRRLGVDGERAAAVLDELQALAAQGGMSPEAVRFVNGLTGFLGHVGLAYAQNDRDLELKTRSLDLCSDELLEANDRLRSELASRTRAIGSLRHTASGLLGGSEPSLPPGDDLESLSCTDGRPGTPARGESKGLAGRATGAGQPEVRP